MRACVIKGFIKMGWGKKVSFKFSLMGSGLGMGDRVRLNCRLVKH